MTLTLSMLRCPERVAPETREIAGGEFAIGRGAENDWVLADPERYLSKRHCVLAYRSGGWQIADLSTNGTFLNREKEPIGKGAARALQDGDRLSFGPYEIEVRIAASASASLPQAGADPFALDPFAPRPRAALEEDPLFAKSPQDDPFAHPGSINLPADYDPLAPEAGEAPFAGPTQGDHSPHLEDAFRPPRVLLPEDWNRDFSLKAGAAAAAEPIAAPPVPVAPAPLPAPIPEAPAPGGDLLAVFLRGAGLEEARPSDPVAAMEALGAAFRALVSGLRQALIARAAIKGEFRIEQTMIKRTGNNPLKFSADDEDAMMALLGAGRRTDMGAAEAIAEALSDMRLHELATVSAMQRAAGALIGEFDPQRVRQAAEKSGRSLVATQRKAHAWEAFEALYARLSEALADDFDSVFGKTFREAYERALAEAAAKEESP
jgi:type VI secretion system FHA domain protein